MTFSDSNRILKISNKFKHDSFIVFLPKNIFCCYYLLIYSLKSRNFDACKKEMCFRSVLGEDELRNLQLSWVPYSGWEGTGRSKEFSSKTCFFSVWTFSWWPWWSHFFIQMFKLIRRRKKRMKERRKKWLKRSRPRSEHQKHKKLNEYIVTWQLIEKGFMEKKFLMIFSLETFIFSFSLLILSFPTFCVIAHLNQSGDGDMECFWSNQFFPL